MEITLERIVNLLELSPSGNKGLADFLGIHPNIITNWKGGNNKSYRKRLPQIAEYFGVSVDYLLGNEKSAQAAGGEDAELSEEDKRMKALNKKISLLSEVKRAALEEIINAMLEK